MGMWSIGAGALGAAALALLLANTDVFLSKSQKATLEYLEDIDLKTLEKEPRTFKAKELWEKNGAVIMAVRRPGCFLCREEAADLSSLKPKLDELGVPLYAVVKEQIRTEVQDFQPYFKGEIFLDEKKKFYGPQRRKMMFMGFVRLGVWYNFFRARNGGFSGNLEGEGFILGGVFVVGSGKQCIMNISYVITYSSSVSFMAAYCFVRHGDSFLICFPVVTSVWCDVTSFLKSL
ncbi:peroxiredoxin-like 2A isoform X3 [Ailuropoda melanoleuca]|nr:peroxiredoxin-like 2A isoform X3 [Ailuropoda melanoleuca]XP_034518675.1 peroxiredoxin-like 2A isoform X3 [Ailuropoda melanoleuca]XP_034518677.1 peroxiredoxin-like 2A isoform X3 [Ailuropoda melanoleuca]